MNSINKIFGYCLYTFTCLLMLSGCHKTEGSKPTSSDSQEKWVKACKDWDKWDKPGPPFRIYGNSYYVGTCGIAAILITSDEGHVLIDGGTQIGATVIANNIKILGYQLHDIKLLLHSHEHFDHVAGLAQLQQLSGAQLLASKAAAPVLNTGEVADDDPQAGVTESFPAAEVGGIIEAGVAVELGELRLTPIATPGHTPGALSWQWQSCEHKQCLSIVYADSLSAISADGYQFSDHPKYVNAYKKGIDKLSKLRCDIVLAPHPTASKMRDRLSNTTGLVDAEGCKNYADNVLQRLHTRLLKEAGND